MKSWTMFIIAIGFLLIAVSPQLPVSMMYVVIGLLLILFGIYRMKKNKNNKE